MNFEPGEDLRAFIAAVERLTAGQLSGSTLDGSRYQYASELDHQLADGGFFDCVDIEGLGRIAAALMVIEVSRLPACAEIVASSLIAPRVCPDLPRPYAMLWDGLDRPARFLPVARSVIAVHHDTVQVATLDDGAVCEIDSVFAYPVGRLQAGSTPPRWRTIDGVDICALRDTWRIGVAAELVGCLSAGLQSVVEHVKQRRQFGRPLGAFQGIQHRLADCATAIEGARWLVLKAADTADTLDATTALAYAQHITSRVTYDMHQFMGAMGLTLEHPLHRWTYRARLLRSEFGGADRQFAAVAQAAWG